MKKQNLKRGFAPFIIIAIVAVLAVGGGVYYSQKDSGDVKTEVESDLEMETEVSVNSESKGSLRTLLSIGKDVVCDFNSVTGNVVSEGRVYISSEGEMRGDYKTKMASQTEVDSHMIVQGETSYVWSGNQGAKMTTSEMNANTNASAQADSSVDLDSEVDYKCSDWDRDGAKFSAPSNVNFIDIDATIKGAMPSGVNSVSGVNIDTGLYR